MTTLKEKNKRLTEAKIELEEKVEGLNNEIESANVNLISTSRDTELYSSQVVFYNVNHSIIIHICSSCLTRLLFMQLVFCSNMVLLLSV